MDENGEWPHLSLAWRVPPPCARPLENEFYPNAVNIIRAAEDMLKLSETDLSHEDFYSYENKFKGPF